MKTRTTMLTLVAALVLCAVAAVAIAQTVTVYNNPLRTKGQVADLRKAKRPGQGTNCSKGLSGKRARVVVGKSTTECNYTTNNVIASCGVPDCKPSFTVSAVTSLSIKPSKTLRKKLFTSVGVRVDGKGRLYRLDVYPQTRKWRLRKYDKLENAAGADNGNNASRRLAGNHGVSFIAQPPKSNRIQIRILQSGTLTAWINGHKVANVHDGSSFAGNRVALSIGRDSGSARFGIGTFSQFVVKSTF